MRWAFLGPLVVLSACGARSSLPVGEESDGGATGGAGGDGGGGGDVGGGGVGGVEQVALGGGHTCVRTVVGEVYCWGQNGSGQLGVMTTEGFSEVPIEVDLDARARLLAAGTYHTCAVLEDDRLFCWGKNGDGQVGNGETSNALAPIEVSGIDGPVVDLSLGERHSCAVSVSGRLYCWGSNLLSQVGVPGGGVVTAPVIVDTKVGAVALGAFHTCYVQEGVVRCMGANDDGQCGVEGPDVVFPPLTPAGLERVSLSRIVSGPGRHTCIESAGQIWCWGDNDSGQLGLGFSSNREPPTPLPNPPPGEVRAIAPGTAHTCALYNDAPFCWGDNFSGQLGFPGPATDFPIKVGLEKIIALDGGSVHTCAYASATEIWCWGTNAFGQLGNGETSDVPSAPVKVELP